MFCLLCGLPLQYNNVPLPVPLPPNVIRLEEAGVPVTIQINDVPTEGVGQIAVGMGVLGEWMRYTVVAAADGVYLPTWKIAVFAEGDALTPVETKITVGTGEEVDPCGLDMEGGGGLALMPGVNTGDYKDFLPYTSQVPLTIPAGEHVLTVCLLNVANYEMNYVDFGPNVPNAVAPPPAAATPEPIAPPPDFPDVPPAPGAPAAGPVASPKPVATAAPIIPAYTIAPMYAAVAVP